MKNLTFPNILVWVLISLILSDILYIFLCWMTITWNWIHDNFLCSGQIVMSTTNILHSKFSCPEAVICIFIYFLLDSKYSTNTMYIIWWKMENGKCKISNWWYWMNNKRMSNWLYDIHFTYFFLCFVIDRERL